MSVQGGYKLSAGRSHFHAGLWTLQRLKWAEKVKCTKAMTLLEAVEKGVETGEGAAAAERRRATRRTAAVAADRERRKRRSEPR